MWAWKYERMQPNETAASHPAVVRVAERARQDRSAAELRLSMHDIDAQLAAQSMEHLRANSRLTLNFHPDRRDSMGRTVAAGLLADGRYRPQFETGISNGGRSAVPGGDRMRWESVLFDSVYNDHSTVRPVYGALDVFRDPHGGSPRFGSCFVVLKPHCLARATLCVGDSHLGPADVGTADELMSIVAGAVEECSSGGGFGRLLSVGAFLDMLASATNSAQSARELDRYVEAQVHGGVDLASDVASVVIDPSFHRTEVDRSLEAAAERYGFEIEFHDGSEVDPNEIDPEFRGGNMRVLARAVARPDGLVDAASIGQALAHVPFTAPSESGDAEDSPRQQYKKLWHCCLKFGRPRS